MQKAPDSSEPSAPIILPRSVFAAGVERGLIKRKGDGYFWGPDRVTTPHDPADKTWFQKLKRAVS